MITPHVSLPITAAPTRPSMDDQALREVALKLEATFLAEMLKSAGLGASRESYGGGAGEDQFGSFLIQEQAAKIVEAGGIGLAESIFQSLKENRHDNG